MLQIGKKRISIPFGHHIDLIEHFLIDAGRVIPYETLSAAMKWRGTAEDFRHCLRQYILQLRIILRQEKVDAHFAVVGGVGYALCESAKN
jgi:DNA-binding response OmpR family regulator